MPDDNSSAQEWAQRQIIANQDNQQRQIDDMVRLLRPYQEQELYAFDIAGNPVAWRGLTVRGGSWPGIATGGVSAWPWKLTNTSSGATGQVQLNGGDGFVASLNGFVCNVNGNPNDTQIGSPLAYPQLSVTGDGVIYGYAVPTTPGTASPLTSLDLFYAGTIPSVDTANPAAYYPFLVATITDYAVDGSGNVSFTVANATNYGWTALIYCGGAIQIY